MSTLEDIAHDAYEEAMADDGFRKCNACHHWFPREEDLTPEADDATCPDCAPINCTRRQLHDLYLTATRKERAHTQAKQAAHPYSIDYWSEHGYARYYAGQKELLKHLLDA